MGQIAEDIVDGTMCSTCGCYFKDKEDQLYTHGHPAVCWDCWPDLTAKEKKNHQKALVETF